MKINKDNVLYSILGAVTFVFISCMSSNDSEKADILADGLDKGDLTICQKSDAPEKLYWQAPANSPSAETLLSESFAARSSFFDEYIALTTQATNAARANGEIPVCSEKGVTTVAVQQSRKLFNVSFAF